METGIYHHHATPMAFVVVDQDDNKFLVMSIVTGWRDRRPFRGYERALQPFRPPEIGVVLARAAGVPKELTAAAQAEGEAE